MPSGDTTKKMSAKVTAILLLLVLALAACGGHRSVVPVRDDTMVSRQPESEYRTVLHGDTLYSIAWESGQDYHDLATWNHLSQPYTIVPGQRLRLYPPKPDARPQVATLPPAVPTKKAIVPGGSVGVRPLETKARPALQASPRKPPVSAPRPTAAVPPPKPLSPTVIIKPTPRPPSAIKERPGEGTGKRLDAAFAWAWPTEGKILRNFTDSGSGRGLDIKGIRGQAVHAAADGRVVYHGSGLRGYGQLIIIKHNDEFLSAYAHNERIYIKEGDNVKRGTKIAAMGDTGADRVKLHFEIRRNGKPVDPLKYLPKR